MIKSFFNIALMVLILATTAIGQGMSQPPTTWSLFPAQSDIMPTGSNTLRLGSADLPFSSASVKVLEGDTVVDGSLYVSQTLYVTNIVVTNASVVVANNPVIDTTTNYNISTLSSKTTYTISDNVSVIFYLPSVAATNMGIEYTFAKLSSGSLTVTAADSDIIVDSAAGGTISDNTALEIYATLTLRLVSETKWVIVGGMGTWVTSQ